ncbi:DUF1614 domain-containing protein [Desulfofundulus thermocisternus]|jgi:uncharacterized membrane protein|uniref:DUF1614 domain-containing protein n=1 Tax=Desulfofundulus thermocisternus TaxID=42471 RepID=UPI001A0E6161|nr:DUF1614 domain-containing protein [Desulfofundulus thermocisternus]MBE3584583.1 DUF1614 domain-containing protein [Thermoanaerobacter sp.]MCS5696602.1 DUF1614 domain-containing protein [Desulfofundulus thermocisternus]
MTGFPVGITALIVISLLIFFGLAHRALDRMRLTDRGALAVIVAMIVGSFISLPIPGGRYPVSINVGGGLIPLGLSIYLLSRAGTAAERIRALVGAGITAVVVYAVGSLVMRGLPEPGGRYEILDALWLYPLVAGLVGYLAGRSRRAAFVSATLGLLVLDVGYYFWLVSRGAPAGRVAIGGAGAFDAIVLAGILAVLLAEVVGEVRERLQGGPVSKGRPVALLRALRKPEMATVGNGGNRIDRESPENDEGGTLK